jgi:hypothetical protein
LAGENPATAARVDLKQLTLVSFITKRPIIGKTNVHTLAEALFCVKEKQTALFIFFAIPRFVYAFPGD